MRRPESDETPCRPVREVQESGRSFAACREAAQVPKSQRDRLRNISTGDINVSLSASPTGLLLEIADGGRGLPETHETREGGLGMRLVRSFVDQIGATLEIKHAPGAEYSIAIPASSFAPSR